MKVTNHFRAIFEGRYLLIARVPQETRSKCTGIASAWVWGKPCKEAVGSWLISLRLSSDLGSLLEIFQ